MALLCLAGCSEAEEEMEPDYDNMVMADDEEGEPSDEERDRKVVLADPPDPQEQLLLNAEEGVCTEQDLNL